MADANTARAGDLFIVHGTGFFDRIVQFGQRIRYGPKYSRWNHAGICIGEGRTLEADGSGVHESVLAGRDVVILPIDAAAQRTLIVRWAEAHRDDHYGWLAAVTIVPALLTGTRLRIGLSDQYFCSGFAATAAADAGRDMGDFPEWTVPALLAEEWKL